MEDKSFLDYKRFLLPFAFYMADCNVNRRIYCFCNLHAFYMIRKLPLRILHLYVCLSLGIFLIVQILKFFSISNPAWVFYYLNDFLVIPMVGTFCLHCVWIIKKDNTIRLDIFTIFSLVALFSIFFEYYLPQQSYRYTEDILDVVCYFMGGVVFFILQKKE